MQSIRAFSPLVRAILVIGAVAALVTSVTFAALSDTAILSGSTMSTTTAGLEIYDFTTPGWEEDAPGFTFDDLVPGVYSAEESFYLRNTGGVDLNVSAKSTAPDLSDPGFVGNTNNIYVTFYGESCATPLEYTMTQLIAGGVALPCNPLDVGAEGNSGIPGTPGNYSMKVKIDASAVTGSGPVNVGAFNITFTGDQVI